MADAKTPRQRPSPERPKVFMDYEGHPVDISDVQIMIDDGKPGNQYRLAGSLAADYLKYCAMVK